MARNPRIKVMSLWSGFIDGKPHITFRSPEPSSAQAGIFKTRAEARRVYEDVRRISIVYEIRK